MTMVKKQILLSWLIILVVFGTAITGCGNKVVYSGAIAYQKVNDTDSQIFVMDPTGEIKTRISQSGGWHFMPSWSPDGETLAYYYFNPGTQMTSVYGVDVTQSEMEQVTLTDKATYDTQFGSLNWSPDGQSILYYSIDALDISDIYKIDIQSGTVVDVFAETIFNDFAPDWAPDGTQFVFASNRPDKDDPLYDLFLSDINGENLVQLTDNNNNGWVDTLPAWSPDGETIAFWRFNFIPEETFDGGPQGIWVYDLAAQEETLMYEGKFSAEGEAPVWSPDGQYLAFLEDLGSLHTLRVIEVDTGELLDISLVDGNKRAVSWAPDSQALIFSNYADSIISMFILDIQSGDAVELMESDPGASIGDPHWGGR